MDVSAANNNNPSALPATPLIQGSIQRLTLQKTRALFENPETAGQKKLKKVANDFEAVFVQQLIDAMDKTVDRSDSLLSGGEAEKTFRGMLNQQLATNIAQSPNAHGGFGMARSVFEQSVQLLEEPTAPAEASQPASTEKPTEKGGAPIGFSLAQKGIAFSTTPTLKPLSSLQQDGHTVLKLSPLHPPLNPL